MIDLARWWYDLRPRCSPVGERAATELASLGEDRSALPAQFDEYLALLEGQMWFGHHVAWDFRLFGMEGVRRGMSERAEQPEMGLWIALAASRSHDAYFLCCDRSRPGCGHVYYGEDADPRWTGPESLRDVGTFEAWLAEIQGWADEVTPVLIALEPDEHARLAGERDPWQLVVAARDLAYALRPNVFSHGRGEPQRIAVVSGDAPTLEIGATRAHGAIIAVLPAAEVAARDPGFALWGWNEHRYPQPCDDSRARLRELAAASRSGMLLYVADAVASEE